MSQNTDDEAKRRRMATLEAAITPKGISTGWTGRTPVQVPPPKVERALSGGTPQVLEIDAAARRIAVNGHGSQSEWLTELMDAANSGALPVHAYLNDEGVPWITSTVKTADVKDYLVVRHGTDLLTVNAEPVPPQDATPSTALEVAETMEQRQDRRLAACEAAGLVMPASWRGRLPYGVGGMAEGEGVTRQSFSTDVKAALNRRESAKKEGRIVRQK